MALCIHFLHFEIHFFWVKHYFPLENPFCCSELQFGVTTLSWENLVIKCLKRAVSAS